ncbi:MULTISPECIES: phosphoribosyltransferase [unclassified Imperialibacter]|uniref:phosphoribosyltransferase n=1 Tax=unclassified Imperialibacter TaxID=2629706 RepID=UPI0012574CF4|nr:MULTISPECIES: phosphoribosyltransferase family protein [unclassified Imperialibacter]CAD5265605.1 Phosphoribosyltransferase [Imperialibacter sp. 89]CAD5270413.1 Phosphoribosyltransferase [Imperialibacter sp. 75]VVT10059.1 Phosphoribosyltransferase [Imperialibacter sp. EC-SDR9]
MFKDRKDAAEQLALALKKYKDKGVLVLGIPRGGAETAYYVASYLHAEFSLVIARKLGYPWSPETAMGALAEDGSLYISDMASGRIDDIEAAKSSESLEIARRVQKYRGGKELPSMRGRTVILVDDGIATGATLFAAIQLCKNKGAAKIVVAAPISGQLMERHLKQMVDEVVILETPAYYQAVSQGYADFANLTDEETIAIMRKWEKEKREVVQKASS